MRVRNVTTALGLGALALVCLAPESAQAQRRRGFSGTGYYPAGSAAYGQSWQPGYFGSPMSYWPGASYDSYGPGQSYAPSAYQAQPMYQFQQPAYQSQPMYQGQPYAYQGAGAPCPPGQPIASSALNSAPPQAMPGAAPGMSTGSAPGAAPGAAATQTGTATTVNVQDDSYGPKTLNVQAGSTVTWVNRGRHAHTVNFDVGRDSGDIAPGGSFSATFPYAGTYHYHCSHHPDMKGTVVVAESGGTSTTGDASKSE